jgi:hypothetical protein
MMMMMAVLLELRRGNFLLFLFLMSVGATGMSAFFFSIISHARMMGECQSENISAGHVA